MQKPTRGLANVKWYSNRQKPRRRSRGSPAQIAALRIADLSTLFRARYGITLPDDDAGRDDAELAAHHLAGLAHPKGRIRRWIENWAPWMNAAEQVELIGKAITSQKHWTADQLAWRLRLTREQRTMLGITTIGAIDYGKAARTKRRKERDRQRKAAVRRAAGVKPRAEYEAAAINRAQPWVAEGISRRTWYRRQRGTRPATA